jgi:hypothetical protein
VAKAETLQGFAFATEERNRLIGSPGLNSTVNWVYDSLDALDYYDVSFQEFSAQTENSTLSVDNTTYHTVPIGGTPEGNPIAPLVAVADLGCNAVRIYQISIFVTSH